MSQPVGDDRFISDNICPVCGARNMRAALVCSSCESQGKAPSSKSAFPIFVGAIGVAVVLGLGIWGVLGIVSWWDSFSFTPPLTPAQIAQQKAEQQRSDAEHLCLDRFENETRGMMTIKTKGTMARGDMYETALYADIGKEAGFDYILVCDVKNGKITSYQSSWGSYDDRSLK